MEKNSRILGKKRAAPFPRTPADSPLPEGPRVLLQGILHHIFILLLAEGARGVDQALQGGEGERVAQCSLLEPSQGLQACLARGACPRLLQLSGWHS